MLFRSGEGNELEEPTSSYGDTRTPWLSNRKPVIMSNTTVNENLPNPDHVRDVHEPALRKMTIPPKHHMSCPEGGNFLKRTLGRMSQIKEVEPRRKVSKIILSSRTAGHQ
jgi:hypothetical protein